MTVDSKLFRVVVNTISNYTSSGTKSDNHYVFDPTDRRPNGDNCVPKSKTVSTKKEGLLSGRNGGVQSLSSRNDNFKQSINSSDSSSTHDERSFTAAYGTTGTALASGIPIVARRPIFKIESQELLPTRRPSLGSRRGSVGSVSSLSSRSSRKSLGRMHRERFGAGDTEPEQQQQPKRVLRSILKKTRPLFPARQQMHSHLGPMIQYRYLQQQQESMQRHQFLPQQHRSMLLNTFSSSHTQRSVQPKVQDRRTSKNTLNRLESSRPLPTPPVTKSVRWASYNEVLEIENVDELIQLGYYNGYDRELGWDYRDESLDESSSDDEDEDFTGSDSDCTFEDEDAESQAAEDDLIQRFTSEGFLLSSATTSLATSPTPISSIQIPNHRLQCVAHATQAESSAARPTRQTPAPCGFAITHANAVTSVVLAFNLNCDIPKQPELSHVTAAAALASEHSFDNLPSEP
ncbi:hypothetical protein BGZ72_006386 [Mortierella alpina]|nr:hypothetical protein BGZ72_006386 [Mortierella alpina]